MHGTIKGQGLIPRATVEAIVMRRDLAIGRYKTAWAAMKSAHDLLVEAAGTVRELAGRTNRFNDTQRVERDGFMRVADVQTAEVFHDKARRIVDVEVWAHVVSITDLERLMDKQARDELAKQLREDPPEATVENIYATLQQFASDADMIFRRGIANVFSKLDRRFRSHDGFKVGSRIILTHMFNEYGSFNYHGDREAMLRDVERTFVILDGKTPAADYAGIVGALHADRDARRMAPSQSITENGYFKVCAYKNGNAHVWLKRKDLARKVNRMLAEHYGEAVGDGQTQDDGGLNTPKTSLAKNLGFFPTPDAVADAVRDRAGLYREADAPPLRILEPSAGLGNLAARVARGCNPNDYSAAGRERLARDRNLVDCVEVDPGRANALRAAGLYRSVTCADFLAVGPDPVYDRVVMNPPFDRERDIDHVVHALKFLKPTGSLVAVMSAGTLLRETKKSEAFRALMKKMRAVTRDLPDGSFASVGTYVNTILLKVHADGRQFWE